MRDRTVKADTAVRQARGRARPRQQPTGKRASFPWINSQIITASESGLPHLMATIVLHLPQMNLVNLSTAVHRVAKLTSNDTGASVHVRAMPAFDELLTTIVGSLGMIDASEAQPQSLSNVAWSLATMRFVHRPLLQVVAALAVTNISCFKPFELSTMLWALAKLSTIDNSSWCMKPVFQAAATHIMKNIPEFGFRCLATTAWAFATARQRHARLFRCIGAQMVPMAHVANCQEIANTAWAYGTADFHDDVLFTELAEKAITRLDEFKPQELSNMLWGFATNGFFHEAFFTRASVVTQHMDLQAQHLANILWAFVRVRPRHPVTHGTIQALLPSCTRQIQTFKPQEVSSTALAVAKAFGNCDEFDRPIPATTLGGMQHSSQIAPCTLSRQVLDFFRTAMPWAVPRLHEFSTQSLANTVSAFAMVRTAGDAALFSAIGHEVMRRFDQLNSTALLHLLKGFSCAPKDSCDHVSKMLASGVAQHVDTFRPQELQTLSRICTSLLGIRRSRDLSSEELRSCCLAYAMNVEEDALVERLMIELTKPAPPGHKRDRDLAESAFPADVDLEDIFHSNVNDVDYPPLLPSIRSLPLASVRLDDDMPLAALRGSPLDDDMECCNPGMPVGALHEADFGPCGPPSKAGLARLPDENLSMFFPGDASASSGSRAVVHHPGLLRQVQDVDYATAHIRDHSPDDHIGSKPQAYAHPNSKVRRDKTNARAIRNQRVTNGAWIAPQAFVAGSLTSINETTLMAGCPPLMTPTYVDAAQVVAAIIPDPSVLPVPALEIPVPWSSGLAEQLLPPGQPEVTQWRCSIKNSFLHFQCRDGGNESGSESYAARDEQSHDDGSSQRSSSVPSRFHGDETPTQLEQLEDNQNWSEFPAMQERNQNSRQQYQNNMAPLLAHPMRGQAPLRSLPVTHLSKQIQDLGAIPLARLCQ